MKITKVVTENVKVTPENAKEILQYITPDRWEFKFVKALAEGKNVSYQGFSVDYTTSSISFTGSEEDYKIIPNKIVLEPNQYKIIGKEYNLSLLHIVSSGIPIDSWTNRISLTECKDYDLVAFQVNIPKINQTIYYIYKSRKLATGWITYNDFHDTYDLR